MNETGFNATPRLRMLHAADRERTLSRLRLRATLAEYLRSWLDGTSGLSPKTLERYCELAERQINPAPGCHKNPMAYSRANRGLARQPDQIASTVVHAHRVLAKVLRRAKNNAAGTIELPKVDDREMQILEADQIAEVLGKRRLHSLPHSIIGARHRNEARGVARLAMGRC